MGSVRSLSHALFPLGASVYLMHSGISEEFRIQQVMLESGKIAAAGRMASALAHEINHPLEAAVRLTYLLSTDCSPRNSARSDARLLMQEVLRASEVARETRLFYRDNNPPTHFDVRNLLDHLATSIACSQAIDVFN